MVKTAIPLPPGLKEEILSRYDGSTAIIDELVEKYQVARFRVTRTANKLGLKSKAPQRWSEEDIHFLEDNWGSGASYCAKKLKRTETAVKLKAKRLQLGGMIRYSGALTGREVGELLNIDSHSVARWITEGKLKSKTPTQKRQMYLIELDDLKTFLEKHQNLWNSKKMKESLWITEPAWLVEKRKKDANRARKEFAKWTPAEDKQLLALFKSGAYTQKQMAERLGRSRGSVAHRLKRLDVWGTGEFIGGKW